ncbi:hypothetical protein [Tuwongella immobilis]|uniref:hypothetical protein n=1 Tax=Tuwongella immobilis TaxID=692036 RepID=UPI0013A688EC|nr:hypothetical protein [Tuwongella immobilis]
MTLRRLACGYLLLQGLGAVAWWGMLAAWPASRAAFRAADAPDSSLLAFAVADLGLFAALSIGVAIGLHHRSRWAWPLLAIHTGAAMYAGLTCWTLTAMTGEAWLGALLMTPPMVLPGWFLWQLRGEECAAWIDSDSPAKPDPPPAPGFSPKHSPKR